VTQGHRDWGLERSSRKYFGVSSIIMAVVIQSYRHVSIVINLGSKDLHIYLSFHWFVSVLIQQLFMDNCYVNSVLVNQFFSLGFALFLART
jgi:hypothetical protein